MSARRLTAIIGGEKPMLAPASRLGPYEIEALAGQGGMGEVYRARDTRLDRVVAIKVLAESLADGEARQRFEREARTIARLEHPNICAVHDIGRVDSADYLVLEYLSGETLAERLQRGALPLRDAMRIAFEIAGALEAAHRQHIVHRDLKPGNVMLTKSGAKLLDFGLAKPLALLTSAPGASRLETTPPITARGTILGTLRYMAPEQVEGRNTDARTDVFAFGAMLYEMITGRPAFAAGSQASIIAAILERDPEPMTAHQPLTPPVLAQVVRGCLEKDPDRRWQSIHDVSSALRLVEASSTTTATTASISPGRPRWRLAGTIGGAAAVVALLAVPAAMSWNRPATPALVSPPVSFEITSPPTLSPRLGLPGFALSADGSTLVHLGVSDGAQRLFLHRLSDTKSVALPGTEGAGQVHISPDGRSIVFAGLAPTVGNLLHFLSLDGGSPRALGVSGFGSLRGLSWGEDGTFVFSRGNDSGLWRLSEGAKEPVRVTLPDFAKGERTHRWPHLLPGGKAVLYTTGSSDIVSFDEATIAVHRFDTGESREVIRGGSFPVYSPTGHLLYARGGAILAAPFDLERLEVTGSSTPVLTDVVTYPSTGAAQFAITKTGVLAAMRGGVTRDSAMIIRVNREGKVTPLPFAPAAYLTLSMSPTSDAISLDIDNANASVWVGDIGTAAVRRLTMSWSNNGGGWTPDGKRIVFTSQRGGDLNIFWQTVDGTAEEKLTTDADDQGQPSFSPDGRYMTFANRVQTSMTADIHLMDFQSGRRITPFISTPFDETGSRISPDGQWIAYRSDESGSAELYVQSFPDLRFKTRISRGGIASGAVWSKRGREMFYVRPDGTMMAVAMPTPSGTTFGTPQPLFRRSGRVAFDVTRDGDFIMVQDDFGGLRTFPLQITLNWPFLTGFKPTVH
jgi:serine/threonine-protein kinase